MLRVCVVGLAGVLVALASVAAQQPLGSLKTEGAAISGTVTVSGGRAVIANSGAVDAEGSTAEISLTRGGTVRVCAGASLRLAQAAIDVERPPLIVALNRGSVEVRTRAEKDDIFATPDFRIQVSDGAPLNVSIRLVPNGDTCVDNAGKDAPILHVTEAFGTGAYFIQPGQHVLFEHGSLQEVVDHETSSCSCPKTEPLVLAGKGKHGNGVVTEAARNNPFPEAESQGLVKPTVPQAPPDETHVQVSTVLNYSAATNAVTGPPGQTTAADALTSPGSAAASDTAPSRPPATPTPAVRSGSAPSGTAGADAKAEGSTAAHVQSSAPPPAGPNPIRAFGRFFRHLFGK